MVIKSEQIDVTDGIHYLFKQGNHVFHDFCLCYVVILHNVKCVFQEQG